MNKFRLILCALAVAVITAGFIFHEVKPIAEDLPHLDGFTSGPVNTNCIMY